MNGTGWTTYNYLLPSLNIDITPYVLPSSLIRKFSFIWLKSYAYVSDSNTQW
jgi:hypothetical protein